MKRVYFAEELGIHLSSKKEEELFNPDFRFEFRLLNLC